MEIIITIINFGKSQCQISWAAQGHVASEEWIQDSIPGILTHIHTFLSIVSQLSLSREQLGKGGSSEGNKDSEWLYLQLPAFNNILRNLLK